MTTSLTPAFLDFQEKVRCMSLNGVSKDNPWLIQGWSQIVPMMILYPEYKNHFSDEERGVVEAAIDELRTADVSRNVRGPVKKVILKQGFPDFEPYDDPELQTTVSEALTRKEHKFAKVDGKLYLMLPELPEDIKDVCNNDEKPHITIINSNDYKADAERYDSFVGRTIDDVEYGSLAATVSLDYTPFLSVIVIYCTSKYLSEHFGRTKPYHFTIRRVERPPLHFGFADKFNVE
jgi:hypothetical protein